MGPISQYHTPTYCEWAEDIEGPTWQCPVCNSIVDHRNHPTKEIDDHGRVSYKG